MTVTGATRVHTITSATVSHSGTTVSATIADTGQQQITVSAVLSDEFPGATISGTVNQRSPSTNAAVTCLGSGTFTGTVLTSNALTIRVPVLVLSNCSGTVTNYTIVLNR